MIKNKCRVPHPELRHGAGKKIKSPSAGTSSIGNHKDQRKAQGNPQALIASNSIRDRASIKDHLEVPEVCLEQKNEDEG